MLVTYIQPFKNMVLLENYTFYSVTTEISVENFEYSKVLPG
jgi:hypothetical protein